MLALTEKILKGNGKVSWCGVNGIIASVQEMEKARVGVNILLNVVWDCAVVDFGCISSRIPRIKFNFSSVKVCVVVGYSPNEGDDEERDRFWNNLDRLMDRVDNVLMYGSETMLWKEKKS